MDKINLADQLKALAQRERALVQAAEVLTAIGNFEQAEAEAKARAVKAAQDAEVAKQQLEAVQAKAAETQVSAQRIIEAAHKQVADVRVKTEADAMTMLKDAQDRANVLLATAKAEAEKEKAGARAVLAQARQDTNAAQNERDEALRMRNAARAEYDDLQAKIASAKDAAKKILGG